MRKALLVLALCGVFALGGSQAYASCGTPIAFGHQFDSWFVCPDQRPVAAFAWQTDTTATTFNSASVRIVCEATDLATDPPCNATGAGVIGDNQVTITGDFITPGEVGCPVDGTGNHRIAVAVEAADGSGLVVTISGAAGYLIEYAEQGAPIPCGSTAGKPRVLSTVAKTATSATVNLNFAKPFVYSDCDPASPGPASGSCPTTFLPGPADISLGNVWTSIQPCLASNRPDPNITRVPVAGTPQTAWTDTGVPIDPATGNATVTVNLPPSNDTTDCAYVGAAMSIFGQRSPGITGYTRIAGALAASPTAEDLKATKSAGKVTVSWKTSSELNLSGFRVLATNSKGEFQLGGLISATGAGGSGSTYTQTYAMGDLKGAKSLVVESLLSDGSPSLRSAKIIISN